MQVHRKDSLELCGQVRDKRGGESGCREEGYVCVCGVGWLAVTNSSLPAQLSAEDVEQFEISTRRSLCAGFGLCACAWTPSLISSILIGAAFKQQPSCTENRYCHAETSPGDRPAGN